MTGYFGSDIPAEGEMRVVHAGDLRWVTLVQGIEAAPLIGERLNISVVVLQPRAVAAVHTHEEEQIGYVVSGSCVFEDGTRSWTLGRGDTYHAPAGAPHGARALDEGCVIIDAFAPPRAGLRELLGQ